MLVVTGTLPVILLKRAGDQRTAKKIWSPKTSSAEPRITERLSSRAKTRTKTLPIAINESKTSLNASQANGKAVARSIPARVSKLFLTVIFLS